MSFNKKTVLSGFTLALLLVSCCLKASADPCPMVGTMDCIKDSACRSCCISNGYTDGHCNRNGIWSCVCTKDGSMPGKETSSIKPAPLGWRGMGTFN
ncbi:hypothetical protein SETIT_8G151300v2 [Setaria italica]|uniref:Defensin-like protein n=2 Tax=Setaria TaxID=4554 RepID=A0A368S7Z9_SETIT|nr:hypothetical protein SETIT_8G151300v2 [Setaria italica]TKW01189.1 hypothetical protein SEVIR_8G163200v2 [Setaria viridis]